MTNYLNTDAKLRNGGRKAPKMSVKQFVNLIKPLCKHPYRDSESDVDKLIEDGYAEYNIINNLVYYEEEKYQKLNKDIHKYEFELENVCALGWSCDDISKSKFLHPHLPILMTKGGVPYLALEGGGDWEATVAFFIYWDGKTFRGYVPTKGNAINTVTKMALGNDEDKDEEFLKKYGCTVEDLDEIRISGEMCIEDFESRIEVKE